MQTIGRHTFIPVAAVCDRRNSAAVCDRQFFFLEIPALIQRRYSAPLQRSFDDLPLFVRNPVKLVNQLVDLGVRGGDFALAPVAAVYDRRFFFLEIPALIQRRYSAPSMISRSSSVIL
jgi:hypothetical protein